MGTDIHIILQSRMDGGWVTHEEIPCDRSYLLFGILAGEGGRRGCQLETGPISEPRGLPKELAYKTEESWAESHYHEEVWLGYHGFSWLSVEEILKYPGWSEMVDIRYTARDCLGWFLTDLKDAVDRAPGTDHRIVFGFDS